MDAWSEQMSRNICAALVFFGLSAAAHAQTLKADRIEISSPDGTKTVILGLKSYDFEIMGKKRSEVVFGVHVEDRTKGRQVVIDDDSLAVIVENKVRLSVAANDKDTHLLLLSPQGNPRFTTISHDQGTDLMLFSPNDLPSVMVTSRADGHGIALQDFNNPEKLRALLAVLKVKNDPNNTIFALIGKDGKPLPGSSVTAEGTTRFVDNKTAFDDIATFLSIISSLKKLGGK